jgi:hypothetical protein
MTKAGNQDAYGVLTEPATLTIRRRLPGPIERRAVRGKSCITEA